MERIEDRYYVFGGYSHLGALNDMYILDYKQLRWQIMDTTGVAPNKRENMGSGVYGKTFYVAGGCDPNHYICYDDTHKFNTTTSEWSLMDKSSLEPKGDFAMDIHEGIIYSFGGAFFLESVYNDIASMDTEDQCPEQCSGNGTCVEDVCECDGGWTGDACDQEAHCEYDCYDRGLCYDQVCECYPGYSGPYCGEVVYCPFNCTSIDLPALGTLTRQVAQAVCNLVLYGARNGAGEQQACKGMIVIVGSEDQFKKFGYVGMSKKYSCSFASFVT